MSDNTPEIHDDMTGSAEPSMEDILASIRKIIADDDTTALEAPEAAISPEDIPVETVGQIDPEPLSALLGDEKNDVLQTDADDAPDLSHLDLVQDESIFGESLSDVVDLEIPDADAEAAIETLPDADENVLDIVAELGGDLTAEPVGDVVNEEVTFDTEITGILDAIELDTNAVDSPDLPNRAQLSPIDDLANTENTPDAELPSDEFNEDMIDLDMILAEMEDEDLAAADPEIMVTTHETIEPYDEALIASDELDDADEEVDEDADLVLVKSLIADLTDETEQDLDGLETQDDSITDDADPASVTEDDLLAQSAEDESLQDDEDESNVLDDILDMTLEDEITEQELHAEPTLAQVEADELENAALNDDEIPSLSDIAASAEEDAGEISAAGALAGFATAAAFTTPSAGEDDMAIPEPDQDDPQAPTPTSQDITQEETADMARTAKKDTIMDEATETATADVFASLNKVVEEKAVKAERGDRIGDLVMEALQPMLKDWLDANLKGIVERAVTKEVKRIASGK